MTIRPAERYPRISIHALREEGDPGTGGRRCRALSFLSTPSARRATRVRQSERDYEEQFLSTPSARRATSSPSSLGMEIFISIHALREEGDSLPDADVGINVGFLSTPSARRATVHRRAALASFLISIHALREEGDAGLRMFHLQWQEFLSTPSARRATGLPAFFASIFNDFYPRPPRGGRPFGPHCLLRMH